MLNRCIKRYLTALFSQELKQIMANQADLDNAIAALTAEVTKLAGDINAALARLAQGADLGAEVANARSAKEAAQSALCGNRACSSDAAQGIAQMTKAVCNRVWVENVRGHRSSYCQECLSRSKHKLGCQAQRVHYPATYRSRCGSCNGRTKCKAWCQQDAGRVELRQAPSTGQF